MSNEPHIDLADIRNALNAAFDAGQRDLHAYSIEQGAPLRRR